MLKMYEIPMKIQIHMAVPMKLNIINENPMKFSLKEYYETDAMKQKQTYEKLHEIILFMKVFHWGFIGKVQCHGFHPMEFDRYFSLHFHGKYP